MPEAILIVDDEKNTRQGIAAVLQDDYEVFCAASAQEAFRMMDAQPFDLVLTDLRMAGDSGMRVIDRAMELPNKPLCVMMTAYGTVASAVEAMKRGAADFLTKPVNLEQLELVVKRLLKNRQTERENKHLKEQNRALHERLDQTFSFKGLIGNSQSLMDVVARVRQVAPTKASVLITGETGTGKELIAQMIHQNSPRARGPFVAVHCGAIPQNLLESELFGHEKGAFTGATERRIGRFEAADGGTLFLDEIGEIAPEVQVKLLRFLETRTLERLGSVKPLKIDVRLVCATHRDLQEMVRTGAFREDLFYRLNVVPILLPPLREHSEDIPALLTHYIKFFAQENNVAPPKLAADALERLTHYSWPGNVRKLRNFCENLVVTRPGMQIRAAQLDPKYLPAQDRTDDSPVSLGLSREQNDRRLLKEALIRAKGNRTEAAALMGISRRTLHRKLAQWPELDDVGKAG